MTTINNYDQSSTGVNIELSAFRDTVRARWLSEENFSILKWIGRSNGLFAWTDCENIEPPASVEDCYDMTGCTRRDFRAFCMDVEGIRGNSPAFKTLVLDMFQRYGGWKSMALDMLPNWKEVAREGLPDIPGAVCKYDMQPVTGCSQGDYACVLIPNTSDYKPGRRELEQLFYDCPVYFRVTVNREEYYPDSELSDLYEWDTDKALEACKAAGVPEGAMAWIEKNIPETLDYCD